MTLLRIVFIIDALAGRRDSVHSEKRHVRKDGSIGWTLTRREGDPDRAASPLYFVLHVQDLSDRQATLGLLQVSQRTLRAVIDHTPAMITVGGRDHRYRLVNREFATAFGVTNDWIVGRLDSDILPAERIAAERAQNLLVLDGGAAVHEEQMRNGRECVRLITRCALRDEDGLIDAVCTCQPTSPSAGQRSAPSANGAML